MSSTNALVKVKLPEAPLASIPALREALERVHQEANLLSPAVMPDFIPPMHKVSLRAVLIDPDPSPKGRGEVYHSPLFCQEGEVALTKVGLLKIWRAAGGSIVESRRTDDRSDPFFVEWQVRVKLRQLDGNKVEFVGTKEVDLRDGSPQLANMKAGQVRAARQMIAQLAESKALLRAIRGALAIPQKFRAEQLQKPFVVPVLVADPDTSDPEIRRMTAAKALGLENMLYGPQRTASLPAPEPVDVQAIPEETSRTAEGDGATLAVGSSEERGAGPASPPPVSGPPSVPLPVPAEAIFEARDDRDRRNYLRRLNEVFFDLSRAVGSEDEAREIAAPYVAGIDWLTAPLERLAEIGKALRQEIEVREGGAA